MKTLTRLLLTLGLCGLSLPAFSANESCDVTGEGALNVADIVQMVNGILNPEESPVSCAGDYEAAFSDGVASVDDSQMVCETALGTWTPGAGFVCSMELPTELNTQAVCEAAGGTWGFAPSFCTPVDLITEKAASHDEGFIAGVASVDITSDNEASYGEGYAQACADTGGTLDCNDICGGDDTSCEGCDGVQHSGLVDDECGVCGGAGATYECGCADIAEGACDCAGNVLDCKDVCGGDAVEDACGVCEGDGASCCYSTDFFDYYNGAICFESWDCCFGAGGEMVLWDTCWVGGFYLLLCQ